MRYRVLAAFAGFLFLVSGRAEPPHAQERIPAPGTRIVMEGGPSAIDGGLRTDALAVATPTGASFVGGAPMTYVPGRVIVKFREGSASPAAFASVTTHVGAGARLEQQPYANFHILTIGADEDPEDVARELSQRADVEYAQADYLAHFDAKPNDPLYSQQWNLTALDMERAWDINPGATRDVVVAVLDSGIAYENTIVRYNTRPFVVIFGDGSRRTLNYGLLDVPFASAPDLIGADRIVAPYDFTWNDEHPLDTLGHGTHVAGTIGQLTNNSLGVAGMAYNVKLMPVKVAGGSNWDFLVFNTPSPFFSDDQVARAIRYAADHGANAMNMSFGRSGAAAPVVEDAVRYAVSKGTFCVFSAGNGGQFSVVERYAEIAPKVEGAVAVGAVGPTLNRAQYSSVGSWVELSAPGGDFGTGGGVGIPGAILQQTLNTSLFASPLVPPRFDGVIFGLMQGTSMAAPHVTGFAALLYQQGITSPAAIEAAMKKYATDKGPAGRDNEYGLGMINPRATLRGLGLGK